MKPLLRYSDRAIVRDEGEFMLMFIPKSGAAIKVDGVGLFIGRQIYSGATQESIVESIINTYEVGVDEATRDLDEFISSLRQSGFVEVMDAPS